MKIEAGIGSGFSIENRMTDNQTLRYPLQRSSKVLFTAKKTRIFTQRDLYSSVEKVGEQTLVLSRDQ